MARVDCRISDARWREDGDPRPLVRRAARATLAEAGCRKPAELTFLLADDATVRALNARWRGKDRATNVLSFPAGRDGDVLGDIVLAVETVRGEAIAEQKTLSDHLAHLVVHGVLHLLGRDHDTPDAAQEMEALEVRALARLGIADPYAGGHLVADAAA